MLGFFKTLNIFYLVVYVFFENFSKLLLSDGAALAFLADEYWKAIYEIIKTMRKLIAESNMFTVQISKKTLWHIFG